MIVLDPPGPGRSPGRTWSPTQLEAAAPTTVHAGVDGEAVDLGQTPGDIVILSAADTELASLAAAQARRPAGAPTLRLANLLKLRHPLSVDLHVERVVARARLVILWQ